MLPTKTYDNWSQVVKSSCVIGEPWFTGSWDLGEPKLGEPDLGEHFFNSFGSPNFGTQIHQYKNIYLS